MKSLIYIPARSGSKRIKNKNFTNFYGKPLIFWTIEFAIKLRDFDKIIISTDSKKWGEIIRNEFRSKNNIIDVSIRPARLSNDKSNIIDAIKYDLKKVNPKLDILLLQPTSPFRSYVRIKNAIKYYKKNKIESLASFQCFINEKNIFIFNKKKLYKEKKYYKANGNFYLISYKKLLEAKKFITEDTKIIISNNNYENIDIDYHHQWRAAELILDNKELPNHILNRFRF